METILITGAAGFVGANLTQRLLEEGYEVNLFLKENTDLWRINILKERFKDGISIHEIDITDGEKVTQKVSEIRPTVIFHLAVHGAYSYQTDPYSILRVNIFGTANLVEACIKVGFKLFVNTGTSSEYGFKQKPATEVDWLEPNSYYAVSKASTTMYCNYASKLYNLPIITLRLYSVYGRFEEKTRLIPNLIKSGLNNSFPPLVSPETRRDFIYIDDVLDVYYKFMKSENSSSIRGEVFNVGTGKQTSLREVVSVVKGLLNIEGEPVWGTMPGRIWDTSIWVSNNEKIKNALRWSPRVTISEGLKEFIFWYKEYKIFYE